jgi:hypothetical protein
VTTRRGSGVPSVGPRAVPARPGDAHGQAVDLAEVRRTGPWWQAAGARRGSPGAARDRL